MRAEIITNSGVTFQVLAAASMKMADSWDSVRYSLIEVHGRFRVIVQMMEVVSTYETSIYF
jgi:hypothetical protein